MSGDEPFLARWWRRKRNAVVRAERRQNPPPESEAAQPIPAAAAEPVADLPLPPIESIAAESDVTPFLAPGVPAALTRAALRRAWTADPAIRDFIGLSENAWDFNAPGGVPGFGSVNAEDVRRLVAQVFGEAQPPEPEPGPPELANPPAAAQRSVPEIPAVEPPTNTAAVQYGGSDREEPVSLSRRRHGGALPQ